MNDRLTPEQLADRLFKYGMPKPGSTWRHKISGELYMPLSVALQEADLTPVVVYVSQEPTMLSHSIAFTRPVIEWNEKFEEA